MASTTPTSGGIPACCHWFSPAGRESFTLSDNGIVVVGKGEKIAPERDRR